MTEPTPEPHNDATATLAALAVGALVGGFGVWASLDAASQTTVEERVRDYTDDELQVVCLPFAREMASDLEDARTEVSALEVRVRYTEQEIQRLETAIEHTDGEKDSLSNRLVAFRSELSALQGELQSAVDEKEALEAALIRERNAREKVMIQLAEREAQVLEAREDALDEQWTAFTRGAMLEICEGGGAWKMEQCRELVRARMNPLRARWKDCIRGGQAIPELREAKRRQSLPEFAVYLDASEPELESWYVLFCDPNLPEARRDRGTPASTSPPTDDDPDFERL